ncbi:MAG TPA: PfkB family carbohydrate kinase [Ktedonobacteraceae bacterium]|jgi:sugar/nucleoside kinase (ribokinase family)|nr:PfkB family carbohydrate kinase [Ktedonobacteraceae bacterium]
MSPLLQPSSNGGTPDFLTIGHVTRDLHPDGSYSLGGTVTFAALTAYHLGLASAIVTCADAELIEALPSHLPSIGIAAHTSPETTTFVNIYHEGFRTQYLKARAELLQEATLPADWLDAPVVLLGPLDQELPNEVVALFPRRQGRIVAATPQGWLRRWDEDGRVWPTPWTAAPEILPLLDVLILSHDDLLPFADGNRVEADAILARWSMQVPLLVATDGRHGATLFRQGQTERFPAYPAHEVDPTGAGDVFAAAFLIHLHRHGDPRAAVDFANCVASLSIEHVGISGIPDLEAVRQRMEAREPA